MTQTGTDGYRLGTTLPSQQIATHSISYYSTFKFLLSLVFDGLSLLIFLFEKQANKAAAKES